MQKYQPPFVKTADQHDEQQMQEWLANSHYWVEEHQTMHCGWCGKVTTTSLEGDANLCPKNPEVMRYLEGLEEF